MHEMNFFSILVVASMPLLKLLLLGALGALLATRYINVLPLDARKHLNKLVFSVFAPAVVFCNLVQAVTPANIIAWWFLPINVVITFLSGGLLGLIVVKIFKPEPHLERLTIACCSAGNIGNLPLVLIPAVCMEPKSPFEQTQVCIGNGVAYVSFGLSPVPQAQSVIGFFWSKLSNCAKRIPLGDIVNPPTTAVVVAFFIGAIPTFKHALIGPDAPLRLIQDSLSTLGNAMLPSMILLLGGNLTQGLGSSKMKVNAVAGIVVAKLIVLPTLGLCIVLGASHLSLIPADSLFHFVLLMQYAMPTAMTIGIIMQLFGVGEQVSLILLCSYLASVVTTTIWTMIYIWLLF